MSKLYKDLTDEEFSKLLIKQTEAQMAVNEIENNIQQYCLERLLADTPMEEGKFYSYREGGHNLLYYFKFSRGNISFDTENNCIVVPFGIKVTHKKIGTDISLESPLKIPVGSWIHPEYRKNALIEVDKSEVEQFQKVIKDKFKEMYRNWKERKHKNEDIYCVKGED